MASGRQRYSIISDGLPTQLPDIDPDETKEWIDSLDDVVAHPRPGPRPLPHAAACSSGPASSRSACPACAAPTSSTRSRPSASPGSPATSTSSAGSAPTSGGTPRSWCRGRTGPASASAATSPPTRRRPACTRSASTTSSAARTTASPATRSSSRATRRPASTPARSSRAGCTEDQLDGFRQELSHPGGGLPSYPHPRLMPDFWEFPTVSMGLGAINAIYQARFNRYLLGPGDQGHQPVARVGVPRRRRDGRARGARRDRRGRARGARQPHLRHQLQPAAPRRPGARQREDHPGARVVLPRRRLERDQGHLGPRLGPAAGPRHRRRAGEQDEHHAGRPVPDLQRRVGRLHPRALLRRRPAAARDGRARCPTTSSATCPAAATTTARCTRRSRRPASTSASRR